MAKKKVFKKETNSEEKQQLSLEISTIFKLLEEIKSNPQNVGQLIVAAEKISEDKQYRSILMELKSVSFNLQALAIVSKRIKKELNV